MPRDVGVILVAAGRGLRVGSTAPKQFLVLAGAPVLLRALRPFSSHPDVIETVVVIPRDEIDAPPDWLAELQGESFRLVAGGDDRRASVAAGLAALSDQSEVVLIHDGARPFPPREVIDCAIDMARDGHAAVPALPVADTVKRADRHGRVLSTVDRSGLWRVQTPQGFPRSLIIAAHAAKIPHLVKVTDDAMLVELIGGKVTLFPGSTRNIKITTPDDLELAGWLASQH